MGIIKGVKNSVKNAGTTLLGAASQLGSDAFAEYFRCEGMTNQHLMIPAKQVQRKIGNTGKRANTGGTENLISNGSVFDVAMGQCAILIENGMVHDCINVSEDSGQSAGQYTFLTDMEPSFAGLTADEFSGGFKSAESQGFGTKLKETAAAAFEQYKHRMVFGGQSTNTMTLFYINTKPVITIPVGAGNILVRDRNIRTTIKLGVHGNVTLRIANPVFFYENKITDPTIPYTLSSPDGAAFIKDIKGVITTSLKNIVTTAIKNCDSEWWDFTNHQDEINAAIIETIGQQLFQNFGVAVKTSALECDIDADQMKKLEEFDEVALRGSDADYMRGTMMKAQAEAMTKAAGNSGGSMMGIYGMNGMMNASNNIVGNMGLNNMPARQPEKPAPRPTPPPKPAAPSAPAANTAEGWTCECGATGITSKFCPECGKPKPAPKPAATGWDCECGATGITSKFCPECGKPKPEAPAGTWNCSCCGTKGIKTKFCPECGSPKPAEAPKKKTYKCDKCGWVPEDPTKPPRFCPECGDVFDANDAD